MSRPLTILLVDVPFGHIDLFQWYNTEYNHSAFGWITPEEMHCGQASRGQAAGARCRHTQHPEHFVRKRPEVLQLPEAIWINPLAPIASKEGIECDKTPCIVLT